MCTDECAQYYIHTKQEEQRPPTTTDTMLEPAKRVGGLAEQAAESQECFLSSGA